jgi:hypothetical protein
MFFSSKHFNPERVSRFVANSTFNLGWTSNRSE